MASHVQDGMKNLALSAALSAKPQPYITPKNKHLAKLDVDHLYHLGFDTSMDLNALFGDVKFVCMGGSPDRMRAMAERCALELGLESKIPFGCKLCPVGKSERYHMYKIGPIICVSHGMGMPSLLILLHEIAKLLMYARATDFSFIRVGTSGGVGVKPGTVVLTTEALNTELKPVHRVCYLGRVIERPTHCCKELVDELLRHKGNIEATVGATMGTNDFYEEQARMDGFLCEFNEQDHMDFLKLCYQKGVRNIEMESAAFADFCNRAGVPGAIVCCTLVDRLKSDQIESSPEQLKTFAENAVSLVLNYIRAKLTSPKK